MCWRGKQKERQGGKKNTLQSVNQVLKDGYDVFFVLFGWLAEMIEGATIFLFLSFLFYDHCFVDKGDLLWEIHGK